MLSSSFVIASFGLEQGAALLVVAVLFLVGLVASLLPVVPGTLIIWIGILVYKLWVPQGLGWTFVIVTGLLTLFAQLVDLFCSYYGARRFGATWYGGVGALLGAVIGPLLLSVIPGYGTILGLIIGPVIGAVAGELLAGRSLKEGGRAGLGSVLGGVLAFAIKLFLSFVMIVWFGIEVWRAAGA